PLPGRGRIVRRLWALPVTEFARLVREKRRPGAARPSPRSARRGNSRRRGAHPMHPPVVGVAGSAGFSPPPALARSGINSALRRRRPVLGSAALAGFSVWLV